MADKKTFKERVKDIAIQEAAFYAHGAKSRPKTLLKGNELSEKAIKIDLIFSKRRSDENFKTIVYGDISDINDYDDILKDYLDEDLLNKLKGQRVYSHI